MKAQLWQDEAERGSWNMALDWAMLQQASLTSNVILRVYSWSQPTISLGYFQNFEEFQADPRLRSLECVRRVTGGGAILHDREWTYSMAIPESLPHKGHSEQVYRRVHGEVEKWLNLIGIPAKTWDSNPGTVEEKGHAFMCFERRSPVDLVVGDEKVLGSAQRRTEFGLLQHGSLLLEPSLEYPMLRGLSGNHESCERLRATDRSTNDSLAKGFETIPSGVRRDAFVAALRSGLDQLFQLDWSLERPSAACCKEASIVEKARFAKLEWTQFKSR
jgi:lipoate-protein ligase A